ncbi:MAG: inositol monophosphatase [Clostridia bacterium]|nr:inositol monophosphatase [Clostridia bacterium]
MLSEIMAIVRETGKSLREVDIHELSVREKTGKRDLCTAYDVAIEEKLVEKLSRLLPEAQFIGEERSNLPLSNGWCFVIDPIDGTANFVHDYRHSCLSVALLKDMVPVIGVVYDPYMDELFYAQQGNGAFVNGRPLHIQPIALSDAFVSFGTTPYEEEKSRRTMQLLGKVFDRSQDIRRSGSAALDLCYVAAGRTGAFFELALSPWDYAAGALIVTEAGGVATAVDGSPLVYNRRCSVLAGNALACEELSSILCE